MSDDSFKDPTDPDLKQTIYHEIQEIKSPDEAFNFVQRNSPEWIREEAVDYADEYPKYKENWSKVCSITHSPPRKILIVEKVMFDLFDPRNEYTVLKMISEILTRCGYCIRRKQEFTLCQTCRLAILRDSPTGSKCKKCSRIENQL